MTLSEKKIDLVQSLTLELSFDQILRLLFQLPNDQKIRLADELRAAVAAENWKVFSKGLPNVPEISMEEIVEEIKAVRKERGQRKQD